MKAVKAEDLNGTAVRLPAIGVFATCDPRIDAPSRERAVNIVGAAAEAIAARLKPAAGLEARVIYANTLVDGETTADKVARQFLNAGVDVLVCLPDTWAFPQPTLLSLLGHFPATTPLNITTGNSGPKPGVVYCHAAAGAITQSGRLVHINVGRWPDTGVNPEMSAATLESLIDWLYAALTYTGLKGRRVVIFGHDSMGMETALQHVIPTRNTFGLEITRLDMKLLADLLAKKAYDAAELKELRAWIDKLVGKRLELAGDGAAEKFDTSLAMYLIVRNIHEELNAVGGGFMSQLEWGSDLRGLPLPVADVMESLFNSTFDHRGPKPAFPYATEADTQGLLTQLFMTWLSGGNPPLFMDFRKVWESDEVLAKCQEIGVKAPKDATWATKGFVDGDNSGSASFDWAGKPGDSPEKCMAGVSLPAALQYYFPGGGNSVAFTSPGGIQGIAGRLCYSALNNLFSMVWDEAETADLPPKLAEAVNATSTPTWPHTYVIPRYATMTEYKQYAPANHFHMTWNLSPRRLQYWMDMTNVLSVTPWSARPAFVEATDRTPPLLHLQNGGEAEAKKLRMRAFLR